MRFFTICLCIFPLATAADDFGLSESSTGLEIVSVAKAKDAGWVSQEVDGQMTIITNKRPRKREFTAKTLESFSGGDKALVIINYPTDIKGTVLLVHVNAGSADNDLWTYLPAQRRPRRVTDSARRSKFVSSHFTNEDFTPLEVEDFSYNRLPDESVADFSCYTVEARPVDNATGYSKLVVSFDQEELRIIRVKFFDRRDDGHEKTLVQDDFKQYQERFWRPGRSLMTEEVTGETTEVLWINYRFDTGLTDRDFDSSAMERQ